MNNERRKRLEADGWVDETVYEFLEMSSEEAAFVELKLRLSTYLKFRRRLDRMSQAALAKKISSSQSRVAKMEAGDAGVSIDLILRALIMMGVKRPEIARLLVFDEPKTTFTEATTAHAANAWGASSALVYRDGKRVAADLGGGLPASITQLSSTTGDALLVSALSH